MAACWKPNSGMTWDVAEPICVGSYSQSIATDQIAALRAGLQYACGWLPTHPPDLSQCDCWSALSAQKVTCEALFQFSSSVIVVVGRGLQLILKDTNLTRTT